MLHKIRLTPFKISAIYAITGSIWIFFSDLVWGRYFSDTIIEAAPFQTYKGLFFIFVTTILLYSLIKTNETSSRKIRSHLQESEEKYRILYDNNPMPMWMYDLETLYFVSVNKMAIKEYGYSEAAFLSMTIQDIRPKEDLPLLLATVDRNKDIRHEEKSVWRHQKKSGEIIYVEITSRLFYFNNKKVKLVLANNITEKKKAEEQLYAREQSFKALVENSPDIVIRFDDQLRYVYINNAIQKLSYVPAEQFIGKSLQQLSIDKSNTALLQRRILSVFRHKEILSDELSFESENRQLHYLFTFVPELDADRKVTSVLTIARDISDLKTASDELIQSYKELADLKFALDKAAIINIMDADRTITYVNEQFCNITGYSAEELIGRKNDFDNSGYHAEDFFEDIWETISSGQVWQGDIRNRTKSGTKYWVSTTIVPFLDKKNKPYQYLFIRFDVTDRKLAQENLILANKELDNFVYRASHDIRGPLARVMGICYLALMEIRDPEALKYLEMLDKTARHMNSVLIRLLNINTVKNASVTASPIDFQKLIKNSLNEIEKKEHLSEFDLQITVPKNLAFYSDEQLVLTILQNLIDNSIHFSKTNSREKPFLKITIEQTDEYLLKLQIADNGIGIDQSIRDKIFNIFFRGTEQSQGSGLGLYMVKIAVEKLRGNIVLKHSSPQETAFEVALPNLIHEM